MQLLTTAVVWRPATWMGAPSLWVVAHSGSVATGSRRSYVIQPRFGTSDIAVARPSHSSPIVHAQVLLRSRPLKLGYVAELPIVFCRRFLVSERRQLRP